MTKDIKSILGKFALLTSSILLILILGEILMRMIGMVNNIDFTLYMKGLKNSDRLPKGLFVPNYDLFGLRPNIQVLATTSDFSIIYKINSQGLRDKEYDLTKPKDKTRILVFGDSFTYGEGVEYGERFSDIIEKSFPNLEVINFGVPGYGLDQILVKFAAEGLKYSPDYTIIFINRLIIERFSTGIIKNNYVDLENIISKSPVNNSSTAYINRNDAFFNKKRDLLMLDRSFLFSFLNYKFCLFTLKNKLKNDDKKVWDVLYARHRKQTYVTQNKTLDINIDPISARSILLIKRFNDICKEYGIKLILININSRFSNMDFLKGIDNNIVYYDLTNDLTNESKRYRLHFVYDRHYNKKAHSFIGKKTTEILKGIIHFK